MVEATARRILSYAGNDAVLQREAQQLLLSVADFEDVMPASMEKAVFYSARSVMSSRDAEGKAHRSP